MYLIVEFIHWLFPKSKKELITQKKVFIGILIWLFIIVILGTIYLSY